MQAGIAMERYIPSELSQRTRELLAAGTSEAALMAAAQAAAAAEESAAMQASAAGSSIDAPIAKYANILPAEFIEQARAGALGAAARFCTTMKRLFSFDSSCCCLNRHLAVPPIRCMLFTPNHRFPHRAAPPAVAAAAAASARPQVYPQLAAAVGSALAGAPNNHNVLQQFTLAAAAQTADLYAAQAAHAAAAAAAAASAKGSPPLGSEYVDAAKVVDRSHKLREKNRNAQRR